MPRKPASTSEDLITAKEAAAILRVHPVTLAMWRASNAGPPFIKLGGNLRSPVRYRRAAVREYLDGRTNL